ncbi:MAG: hypothetical protein WCO20_00690 [Holophagaceae bacterium]|nr:hypothetical protein [Acidobacteriota bacterium]
MDLYLDAKESELVQRILVRRLEDLRREIHHTDSRSFRADLKAEESLLHALLDKLKAPAVMGI